MGGNARRELRRGAWSARSENLGERFGCLLVAARDGVGVDVERGRRAGVAEPLGHDGDGHAGGEHLGGHEVAQVMQPEMWKAGGTAGPDEPLGD